MRKYFILFLTLLFSSAKAQLPDTLTLEYLQNQAKLNYPLIKQNAALIESNLLKIQNLRAGFYPKADLNAQATYQSDVTQVQLSAPTIDFGGMLPPGAPQPIIKMPSVPSPDKDQYKAGIDLSQLIYDGGMTRNLINLEKANLAADTIKTEVDLYQIRERINQLFFNILFIQEKLKLIQILKNDLNLKLSLIESTTKNGVTTLSDVLAIQAELVKLNQQITELDFSKKAAINILSLYINQKVPESVGFKIDIPVLANGDVSRPEITLFSLQSNKLDYSSKLLSSKRLPKIYSFAQIGYGKPGLNMFKSEFDDYYIIGAKLSWNIWDWEQNKREKQILNLQKDLIKIQQETFVKNIQIAGENEIKNIEKIEMLMQQDVELIKLREQISKFTFSQVENGVKTMDEYLNNTNAELNAKINYQIHKIQEIQSKVNYNNLNGK